MKYQQGDVLFIKSDKEITYTNNGDDQHVRENQYTKSRKNDDAENGDTVVALGEVTGHSHTFYNERQMGVTIHTYGKSGAIQGLGNVPKYVEIKAKHDGVKANSPEKFAVLMHEEHNPIELPPGLYRTRIVREFDHLSQRTRNVVD